MRHITLEVGALAILLLLSQNSMGAPAPQEEVNLKSATAAELEKAADEARAQKNYALAIDYLQAAVRKDRKNSALYNKLGMAELKNNQLDAARPDFEKAAKYNSKNAEAVNNIGAVDYMQKNYGSAVKYFKKAVALEETRATFHVNLGAAWFSQKKTDRAMTEYVRALELDPEALQTSVRTGVAAQIASPEERAQYSYMLAKIYANRGDVDDCLQCLRKAKEDGYRNLANVYKDEEFAKLRDNPKLQDVVPPPAAK
jgi:tetratricopeptide (TPR) repeat protein